MLCVVKCENGVCHPARLQNLPPSLLTSPILELENIIRCTEIILFEIQAANIDRRVCFLDTEAMAPLQSMVTVVPTKSKIRIRYYFRKERIAARGGRTVISIGRLVWVYIYKATRVEKEEKG